MGRNITGSWRRIKKGLNAVTFDDFNTLRYPAEETEDVIYPILKTLKRQGLGVNDEEFLKWYFKEDELYRFACMHASYSRFITTFSHFSYPFQLIFLVLWLANFFVPCLACEQTSHKA